MDGREFTRLDLHDARRLGIITIPQEFDLENDLTVAENIFLGREPTTRWGLLDRRAPGPGDHNTYTYTLDYLIYEKKENIYGVEYDTHTRLVQIELKSEWVAVGPGPGPVVQGNREFTITKTEASSDLTFTNEYSTGMYCVAVTKLWDDENDRDGAGVACVCLVYPPAVPHHILSDHPADFSGAAGAFARQGRAGKEAADGAGACGLIDRPACRLFEKDKRNEKKEKDEEDH